MKNQNKILISLLTASISALAAAPYLIEKETANNDSSDAKEQDKKVVDIAVNKESVSAEDVALKQEIKEHVQAMLTRKEPMVKIGESVDIVTENYGKEQNLKKEVFAELGVGYNWENSQDSTQAPVGSGYSGATNVTSTQGQTYMCHSACHGVCHSNCHGARGWR